MGGAADRPLPGILVFHPGNLNPAPLLVDYLNILEGFDLRSLGHNSPGYVHALSSAIDLGMADGERFYGDPRFVDSRASSGQSSTPRCDVHSSPRIRPFVKHLPPATPCC